MLLYSIIVSELISVYLLYRIWRSQDYLFLKVLITAAVLVPFIGPVFYFIGTEGAPRHRNNLNASGHLFGRGRYTEWWDSEKGRMKKKIETLEKKVNEREKSQ